MLKRSNDRKTTTLANGKGDQSRLKNAFGLPAGREYSCPGETEFCGSICYGKRTEGYLPSVRALLMHNWELLNGASYEDMVVLLTDMVTDFVKDADRLGATKWFRIHWDGDFFSPAYVKAWAAVISAFPDVQFWAYTRDHYAAASLTVANLANLSLYFSMDRDNEETGRFLHSTYGVRLATLHTTFDEARSLHTEITGKPVGKCPEVAGRIPLITTEGGACATCKLCPMGKTDITFSVSGR